MDVYLLRGIDEMRPHVSWVVTRDIPFVYVGSVSPFLRSLGIYSGVPWFS
uniref:Uncharacterized protein n=1 Tax=Nelumbo nucifera TaxID=4432 RepID=A0A822YRI3_NELNU|nr:TPA_asm: hypothetical protein HUJ06_007445 [Nelumbo nucifera]